MFQELLQAYKSVVNDIQSRLIRCLKDTCSSCGFDVSGVFEDNNGNISAVCLWPGGNMLSSATHLGNNAEVRKKLEYGHPYFKLTEDMPEAIVRENNLAGLKSLIAVPMFVAKKYCGFACFASERSEISMDIIPVVMRVAKDLSGIMGEKRIIRDVIEENERLKIIYNGILTSAMYLDSQGKILSINDYFMTYLGIPKENVIGLNITEYCHPQDVGRMMAAFEKSRDRMALEDLRIRVLNKKWLWIRMAAFTLFEDSNKTIHGGYLLSMRNIHRLKDPLLRLDEINKIYARLVSGIGKRILVADDQGYIIHSSEGFDAFLGYGPDELVFKQIREVICADSIGDFDSASGYPEGKPFTSPDFLLMGKEGNRISVEAEIFRKSLNGDDVDTVCIFSENIHMN